MALLEFALVATLLIGLLAAVADFGFGWRRSIEVASTIRGAVRVEAGLGDDRAAEYEALRALNAGIAEIGSANIRRVIVYRSTTATGAVPAACLNVAAPTTASTNGAGVSTSAVRCNVYGRAQLDALAANAARFSGSSTACENNDWDRFYCPVTHREADQGDGADYVGLYVEYRIDWVVGVVPGGGVDADDRAVMRIEPSL